MTGAAPSDRPRVVAHRGAAAEAPENTLEAFDLALELGADALELDVRLARDGTPVVIHDETLDRTTSATGPVRERDAGELRRLAVPGLDIVLERYPEPEITVDVKDPEATARVVELLERRDRIGRTVLYVEEGTDLDAFHAYPGRRATSTGQALHFALLHRWRPGGPPEGFPEVLHTPPWRWGVPLVTPGTVRASHRWNRTVQVWTVDDPGKMRELVGLGVDAVCTNDVRTAVRILRTDGSERLDGETGTGAP